MTGAKGGERHPRRYAFAAILIVLTLAPRGLSATPPPASTLAELPLPAQATISAVLGREEPAYHATPHAQGLQFTNPRHALTVALTPSGVQIQHGRATWGFAWQGYGEGAAPTPPVAPTAHANRVEYRHGSVTEWYVNGPRGLQQGFTLRAPPTTTPSPAGPLTLTLALTGSLRARLDPAGTRLILSQPDGKPVLTYQGLTAWDATGRTLPTKLKLHGQTLQLEIEAAGAQYPLMVDPFVQQAKLTASDGAADDWFGYSVAISGDTVVVGAVFDDIGPNADQGSAYVFVKPGGGWAGNLTQTAKLTASDGAASDQFGAPVAISGNTVVVGAPNDDIGANTNQGSAYVFVKPGGGWAGNLTQTAKLTAADAESGEFFGFSVAISSDTVVVGADGDDIGPNFNQGSAYVFVKPGGGWAGNLTQTAKLTASDGAAFDLFGWSVAISGDTVVVGARWDDIGPNADQGSAYVFVKPGGGWAGNLTQTAKLTAADGAASDFFGASVAIIGDTVVVGAPNDDIGANTNQGSAYVFVKPPGGWTTMTQTAKLTAADGAVNDWFGFSVAISGDTVVVGAYGDDIGANADQGSAYVFGKPGGGWTTMTQTAKLTAADGAEFESLGFSVAISGDTVVVGEVFDDIGANGAQGSAYVFGSPATLTVTLLGSGTGIVTSSPDGINCPGSCTASFPSGTPVTLTAAPTGGGSFGGWGEDCGGAGTAATCPLTLTAAASATATFTATPPPSTVSLTVTLLGSGTGIVTSSPDGINCPGSCTASFPSGTPVTLTAAPTGGGSFGGWGEDCGGAGTAATCPLTLTAAASATATFTATPPPNAVSLTVSLSGCGPGIVTSSPDGINCPGSCTASFPSGTPVTLTAAPTGGGSFGGWGEDCGGAGTAATCPLTLTAAASATATFVAGQIQEELFVANSANNSITVYTRTASGDTAPLRTLEGAATGLNKPIGVAVDLARDELVVANNGNDSITVYARTANGNTAPLRTLQGPATGLSFPSGLALDAANNELVVANLGSIRVVGTNRITVYTRTASGNTAPLRTLERPITESYLPSGLALDAANNELVVSNYFPETIMTYARTASGDTAPLRTLEGAATGLSFPRSPALDAANNELVVANNNGSVTVYTRTASGDTAPLRTLEGAATGLNLPSGLALDAANNELVVSDSNNDAIMTYARTANGDTSPLRTLSGAATGLSGPLGLAVTARATPVLAAAVLPCSRSVQVGTSATAFATLINAGHGTATCCSLAPATNIPATFVYQTTDPATNAVTGDPNMPVDIPSGQARTFMFAVTPSSPLGPSDVQLTFACANSDPAPITTWVNTVLFSASSTPVPDIVALAATASGDGIVTIPWPTGTGAFAVATVNVGASELITASADTGSASLPLTLSVCQTNPVTAACLAPPTSSVATQIDANTTPTFSIFAEATGPIPFLPGTNRIVVRFKDGGGVTRGATSVAVRTVP